jgi:hypothetical protein
MGQLLKSLITDGIKMGISSRALGNINEMGDTKHVSNFHLICLDVVHQPSVQNAMLESVMESKEYMIRPDGTIIESSVAARAELGNKLISLPKHGTDSFLREALIGFINKIKLG